MLDYVYLLRVYVMYLPYYGSLLILMSAAAVPKNQLH